jgi:urease accessory protein
MQIRQVGLAGAGLALVAALASVAHAHTGSGTAGMGLAEGLAHPVGGIDHVLAMMAVGLWAAQWGGRAVWALPAAFLAAMLAGGLLGLAGAPLPYVEVGIVASVLALGALIALEWRPALSLGIALVGVFAVFHGHAHGAEVPPVAAAPVYAVGFTAATALLHAAGVLLGLTLRDGVAARALRASGGAIAVAGVLLLLL